MDSFEHIQIVDEAIRKLTGTVQETEVNGKKFTLGQISALAGDFVASPFHLQAKAEKYKELATWLKKERRLMEVLIRSNKISPGRFTDLSIKNYCHFRHGDGSPESSRHWPQSADALSNLNLRHWQAWDQKVLRNNHFAALTEWAFGAHFLVDLCAAGHIRVPRGKITAHLYKKTAFKDKLKNAELCGAVLSMIAHNEDNSTGLSCEYLPVDDFFDLSDSANFSRVSEKFYGDNHSNSTRPAGDEQIEKLIQADFSHIFPDLCFESMVAKWSGTAQSAQGTTSLASTLEVQKYEYKDFLKRCLPVPTEVSFNFKSPRAYMEEKDHKIAWKGRTNDHYVMEDFFVVSIVQEDDDITNISVNLGPMADEKAGGKYFGLGSVALAALRKIRYPILGSSDTIAAIFSALRQSTSPEDDLSSLLVSELLPPPIPSL
jgi:hypothetical protein